MALNPAYAQQSTRKLPFALGYVYGTGNLVNSITAPDGTTVAQYILGAGEWDSMYMFSPVDGWAFLPQAPGSYSFGRTLPGSLSAFATTLDAYYHFHGGQYSAKGVPLNLISFGPDQGSENWWQYFPSVTPALNYSGFAYYFVRIIQSFTGLINLPVGNLNPIGIYRSTRCRIFDSSGNVTGYGFTVNPTWQMIETLLRYQIKPQQPPLAGLTYAELALFDWPAMVAHAERNATVVASGAPRFTGNFMFAADAKLGGMMEQQLRNCRSYKRERGGVISFVGDDARTSVFIASQRAVVPGSMKLHQRDIPTDPNIYVPQYREIGIPAVCNVVSAVDSGSGSTTFTTEGQQPFFSADYFAYSGSADDADFAGDYRVGLYLNEALDPPEPEAPPNPTQFVSEGGPAAAMSTTGGYLGTEQSRFKQYDADVVQHRGHQGAFGAIAPGINPFPRRTKVFYDLGNNTFDQTNRIMQWMMIRDLGPDVTPYIPPVVGTISLYAEAVDVDGNCAGEIEPGDRITLDDTSAPDFPGDYVVQNPITDNPPVDGGRDADPKSSTRELALQTYQPTSFPDTSYPPGDSYQTLPNSQLPTADAPVSNCFYLMQATPNVCLATDGTLTMTISDLSIWWAGQAAPTTYPTLTLTEIPFNSHVIVYLVVSSLGGTAPYLSLSTATYPPIPVGVDNIVIFIGTVTAAPACTVGGGRGLPRTSGGSGSVVFTTPSGYLGGDPTSGPPAPPTIT